MFEFNILDLSAILFGLAAIFGLINHHFLRLPFTIGMTLAALIASVFVLLVDLAVPELGIGHMVRETVLQIDFTFAVLKGMLGFLLFAGALHTDIELLRSRAIPVLLLATIGTLLSTTVVGLGSYYLFSWLDIAIPFLFCLAFGALISPTDPIAVLGIMRVAKAPPSLEVKIIGESLFNDGIGVVLFAVLISLAESAFGLGGAEMKPITASSITVLFLEEVVGGIGLGLVLGYITYRAMRTLEEPNLEILISFTLVLVINFLAFRFHTSAPLACVVAGLFIGNRGRYFAMNERTRSNLDTVWAFIDESLNAILFLLIGIEVVVITFNMSYVFAAILAIPLALLGRVTAVTIPLVLLKAMRFEFLSGTKRVLIWGGLKGGISVALAMSLPSFEGRDAILTATYAVVVFSIIVQGLTIGGLLRRLMPATPPDDGSELGLESAPGSA